MSVTIQRERDNAGTDHFENNLYVKAWNAYTGDVRPPWRLIGRGHPGHIATTVDLGSKGTDSRRLDIEYRGPEAGGSLGLLTESAHEAIELDVEELEALMWLVWKTNMDLYDGSGKALEAWMKRRDQPAETV